MMRPSVAMAFPAYTARFEGVIPWPYLDVRGLVTTAVGLLIDPIAYAMTLPWQIGGYAATQAEIVEAWNLVKSRQDLAPKGGVIFAGITNLRLSTAAINSLTIAKATSMDDELRSRFRSYDQLSDPGMLATLSMAWAMGVGGFAGFPKFSAALEALDYTTCAAECKMSETGNPELKPRNDANRELFQQAAREATTQPEIAIDLATDPHDTIPPPKAAS